MGKNSKKRNKKQGKQKTMKGSGFMSNFSFGTKVKDADKDKAAKAVESTTYDSMNVTSSNKDEQRLTESALTQQAGIYGEGAAEAKKSLKDHTKLKVLKHVNALRTLHKSDEKLYNKLDKDLKWIQAHYDTL